MVQTTAYSLQLAIRFIILLLLRPSSTFFLKLRPHSRHLLGVTIVHKTHGTHARAVQIIRIADAVLIVEGTAYDVFEEFFHAEDLVCSSCCVRRGTAWLFLKEARNRQSFSFFLLARKEEAQGSSYIQPGPTEAVR